jgi:predicted PurR-regulated permease PerM
MPDLPVAPDLVPPTQVQPPEAPGLTSMFALLVGVVTVASLYFGREVLIPVTLAVLLSFLLTPLVNLLHRLRLGRVPSVIIAVIIAIGVILALGGLIGLQIAQLSDQLPAYQFTIEQKITTLRDVTVGRLSTALQDLSQRVGLHIPQAPQHPGTPSAQPAAPAQNQAASISPMAIAESVVGPVVSPIGTMFIVIIVTIFVLLQREDLRDRLIRLFGSGDLHRTTAAMDDAASRLSRYFLVQLCINATYGCVIGLGLAVIGIPSPILWGTLAMMLRFVPYIGAPLSALLPLLLAAAVSNGWSRVLWTAGLFIVCETITGQAIEPVLYGRSTGLSPAAVMIAAIFWTWLWGPIGLILSTPLTLCLVVLGRHFKRLEFLDVMLGDRPALSPVESFYQRMLAGDPDEAEDQAELLLRDMPLSSYYDEVALKGLQLAANDAARGVLTPDQTAHIRRAIEALVHDLDDHDDHPAGTTEHHNHKLPVLAPEWSGEHPVLCIAGRGPLDDGAALMLSRLLTKHGLGARAVPHEAVSRSGIPLLDPTGVAMLCISYLEITGSPAHLRFLLRRIRQRFPTQPILVGLWPSTDEVLHDERLRAAIGADYYASSLHGAVQACLEAARKASSQPRETSEPKRALAAGG